MPNAALHEIELPTPYSLFQTLRLHRLGRADPTIRLRSNDVTWAMPTPDGPVTVQAAQHEMLLRIRTLGDGSGWLTSRLPDLFGLNDIPESLPLTGPVRKLVAEVPGVHLIRLPQIFPRLIQTVLQQLVSWDDAAAGWRNLVRKFGDPAPGDDDLILPPTAKKLKSLAYFELVECGILPRQARLILRLAEDQIRIEKLAAESERKLSEFLVSIPGIGRWTIAYVLGTALASPDVVLTGDYALPHTVSWFFKRQPRSNDEEMIRLLEPYRGHRFRVQHLLMQSGITAPRFGPKMESNRTRFFDDRSQR